MWAEARRLVPVPCPCLRCYFLSDGLTGCCSLLPLSPSTQGVEVWPAVQGAEPEGKGSRGVGGLAGLVVPKGKPGTWQCPCVTQEAPGGVDGVLGPSGKSLHSHRRGAQGDEHTLAASCCL